MKGFIVTLLLTFFLIMPLTAFSLNVGEKAPLFEAPSTMGTIKLGDYQGKQHVVLALYMKDFTPV